ncbi:MAG: hypothetical protein LBK08_00885 [Treponema sp.]|jgi:hypothetical protein|nr:hypothetical protein [Treponema sp.]
MIKEVSLFQNLAGFVPSMSKPGGDMGEHVQYKKESKKVPQKTLKEKREEKKNKKKGQSQA